MGMAQLRPVQSGHDRPSDLVLTPIRDGDVLAGEPMARCTPLSLSADGTVGSGVWDCTAGRFRWCFGSDEIVHVVEGEVRVTDEHGHTLTLGPGDVAHFERGTTTTWDVPVYVRKLYVAHMLPGDPLSRGVHALRQWARGLRHRRRRAVQEPAPLGALTGA